MDPFYNVIQWWYCLYTTLGLQEPYTEKSNQYSHCSGCSRAAGIYYLPLIYESLCFFPCQERNMCCYYLDKQCWLKAIILGNTQRASGIFFMALAKVVFYSYLSWGKCFLCIFACPEFCDFLKTQDIFFRFPILLIKSIASFLLKYPFYESDCSLIWA